MSLTTAQLEARAGKLTASAVGVLMKGGQAKIQNLWRELIGHPGFKRDNLDGIWAVQLGNISEQLNLDWYERKTGNPVARRGEVVVAPSIAWAAATLDGFDTVKCIPVECKHVGGFEPIEVIVERYKPQCNWQMMVLETDLCAMSVIMGAKEPAIIPIYRDEPYLADLFSRAEQFMECVWSLCPPTLH